MMSMSSCPQCGGTGHIDTDPCAKCHGSGTVGLLRGADS